MEKLTERQKDILQVIKKLIAENGYPPTVREIGKEANLASPATIHFHINKLAEKGYIAKGSKNRTIKLLVPNEYIDKENDIIEVAFIDSNNTKKIVEEIDLPKKYFTLPINLVNDTATTFVLKTNNQNMAKSGILDDDILIVEKSNTFINNDIVVALMPDDKITVRILTRENGFICLSNDSDKPIIVKNITILGKVIGLYRKF